jgi:hypothetical protein
MPPVSEGLSAARDASDAGSVRTTAWELLPQIRRGGATISLSVAALGEVLPTMRTIVFAAVSTAALLPIPADAAASTGFDPRIITFGETREQLQSTPILDRPYRPLHVYGNTVRRRHNRAVAPTPRLPR